MSLSTGHESPPGRERRVGRRGRGWSRFLLTVVLLVAAAPPLAGQPLVSGSLGVSRVSHLGQLGHSYPGETVLSVDGAIHFLPFLGIFAGGGLGRATCDLSNCLDMGFTSVSYRGGLQVETQLFSMTRLSGQVGITGGSIVQRGDYDAWPFARPEELDFSMGPGLHLSVGVDVPIGAQLRAGAALTYAHTAVSIAGFAVGRGVDNENLRRTYRETVGDLEASVRNPEPFRTLGVGLRLAWHPSFGRDRGPVRTPPIG